LFISKGVAGKNLYSYLYSRLKIYIHTRWVLNGYQVPVGFVIPYIKIILK
jgi:hypothetical protein